AASAAVGAARIENPRASAVASAADCVRHLMIRSTPLSDPAPTRMSVPPNRGPRLTLDRVVHWCREENRKVSSRSPLRHPAEKTRVAHIRPSGGPKWARAGAEMGNSRKLRRGLGCVEHGDL